jgi:hypothetical protein
MTDSSLTFDARYRDNCKTTQLFAKADRIDERELHDLKWFDYRFMSPREATLKFREEFQTVYRQKYARNIDTEEAPRKFGVRRGDPESHKAEFTSLWRARQSADLVGAPYDIFLNAAFDILLRGHFERMPAPNQFYRKHAEKIAIAVRDHWDELCGTRFMYATLPQYQEASFFGLPAQIAHRVWVIEQIKKLHSNHALGRACFTLRILPEAQARAAFGDERLEMARAIVADDAMAAVPHTACKRRDSLPSCAMLPGAMEIGSSECSKCKIAALCARGGEMVLQTVIGTTGVSDPVESRKRALGKERTRKCRERARTAEVTASLSDSA